MTNRVLYLFPDTNLFIQCRPLEEIDWSDCGDFEEVHLIVCRTVQREIDNQKNRGNDRIGQRARRTSSFFGDVVRVDPDSIVVREGPPLVKLYFSPLGLPSPELSDRLDYNKSDDEIIGYVHSYIKQYENDDIRLLTHDSGPMMAAQNLGIPFIPVPDSWLLQPENNETERENSRLKQEITRLHKTEPRFQTRCIDEQGEEVESVEVECKVYEPLTLDDVRGLIRKLRDGFPPMDEVEAAKLHVNYSNQPPWIREERVPPSRADINEYNRALTDWKKECEGKLSDIHQVLKRDFRPNLRLAVVNDGTRPGRDALVTITAKGDFKVYPQSEEEREHQLGLPSPPNKPRLRSRSQATNIWSLASSLSKRHPIYFPTTVNHQRDPNSFYYKPSRPTEPVESYSLECEQWRHGIGDQFFDVEICVDGGVDDVSGAIEYVIYAENLSTPCRKLVPVKIKVERESTKDCASRLVLKLLRSQHSLGG